MANAKSRNAARRRGSGDADEAPAEGVTLQRNPHPVGTAQHGAWERMQLRKERDAEFRKTPEGERSAKFHNAHLAEGDNRPRFGGGEPDDPISLEGQDDIIPAMDDDSAGAEGAESGGSSE